MTLLDKAIERLRALPLSEQEQAAEKIHTIVDQIEPGYRLTPEQIEEVRQTVEGLRDGSVKLASDEQIKAMWRRLGA